MKILVGQESEGVVAMMAMMAVMAVMAVVLITEENPEFQTVLLVVGTVAVEKKVEGQFESKNIYDFLLNKSFHSLLKNFHHFHYKYLCTCMNKISHLSNK